MQPQTQRVEAVRLDANRVRIANASGLDIILFANEDVPVDRASIAEVANIAAISDVVRDLDARRFFGDFKAELLRSVLTPDFHKGAGIPIGTVLHARGFVMPRCVGGDVACGMRLLALSMTREEFEAIGPELDVLLRHAFFEGGRDIPLSEQGRAGMLREGLAGLTPPPSGGGVWRTLSRDQIQRDMARTHRGGTWPTRDIWAFGDYVRGSGGVSRDSAIASIGGGNHFCEFQWVEDCLDRRTCYDWGLRRGCVTLMIHTGSVGLGALVGDHYTDLARKLHPTGALTPPCGFYALPTAGPLSGHGEAYLSAMGLAANFATVNRLMLGALALRCLSQALGREVEGRLVYDAPHNLIWSDGHDHVQ